VYLCDVEKARFFGKTITGEESYWATFGPLAKRFRLSLRELIGHEVDRKVGVSSGFSGWIKHCHRIGKEPRFRATLEAVDETIAGRVIAKYGHLSPVNLERAAYETEPMQAEGLERGDDLDFGAVKQNARFMRWLRNRGHQDWRDARYERLLALEKREAEEILSSLS